MYIIVNDERYEIIIEYKNNKNMYLRVKEDGNIYITSPKFISKNEIEKFIKNHYSYINKKIIFYQNKKIKEENKIRYLGKYYDIVYTNFNDIKFIDDKIFISKKVDVDKFLKKKAKEIFLNEIDRIYPLIKEEMPYPSLRIRKMTSRWGVCNSKLKVITLNLDLIKFNYEIIDYVIIHELCHFIYQNHSKDFWNLLSKYVPNYKEIRKKLKY